MTDENPTTSGSRWEPTEDAAQPVAADGPADEALNQPIPTDLPPVAVANPTARRSRWTKGAGLAGAAAGLVLAGGVGGFALGHATAGPDFRDAGFHGGGFADGPGGFGHDRDGDHGGLNGQFDPDGDGEGPAFPPPGAPQPNGTTPDGAAPGGTAPNGTAPSTPAAPSTTATPESGSTSAS